MLIPLAVEEDQPQDVSNALEPVGKGEEEAGVVAKPHDEDQLGAEVLEVAVRSIGELLACSQRAEAAALPRPGACQLLRSWRPRPLLEAKV